MQALRLATIYSTYTFRGPLNTKLRYYIFQADVERERQCYITWQRRVEDWRQLKCQVAVEKFK